MEEGPIFGYSSYQHIPNGTPFKLICIFDDQRGKENILAVDKEFITESEIENTAIASPGTNAVLQIGDATWEFGSSMRSNAKLNTSLNKRRYELAFATPSRGNHISVVLQPSKDSFWPANADWRASFVATSLMDSRGEFGADNNRVSARGHLLPMVLTVSGIDLGEQWLSYTTIEGGPKGTNWSRQWHLARTSHKGGYIVEEVTRTFTGVPAAGSAIVATEQKYWTAWKVPPESVDVTGAVDFFSTNAHDTGRGVDTIHATARFMRGLACQSNFLSAITSTRVPCSLQPAPQAYEPTRRRFL